MTAPAARIAEIVAEANRRHAEIESATMGTTRSMLTAELARFYAEHGPLLLAVAEKTLALFTTLDYVEPGWREETCTVGGDEVNRAWYELEKSLGLGPDAVRGEEKTSG